MIEAKDTVMGAEKINKYRDVVDSTQCPSVVDWDIEKMLEVQAETSFKAGIREVVERYKKDNPSSYEKYHEYWNGLEREWGL